MKFKVFYYEAVGKFSHNTPRFARLLREVGWIVLGQLATVVGALFLVRVLTTHISPTEYGKLALGMTLAGFVNQVIMGGVPHGIQRYFSSAAEKCELGSYLRASCLLVGHATVGLTAFSLLLLFGLFVFEYSKWNSIVILVLFFSFLNAVNSAINSIHNAARQRHVVAIHNGLNAWLKIGLVIVVFLWLGASSTSVIIGYSFATSIVLISQLYHLKFLLKKQRVSMSTTNNNNNWGKLIWSFSLPFSGWGVFVWLQQASDRWALQFFSTAEDVGMYAVLYQLGFVSIVAFSGIVTNFLAPIFYMRSGDATDFNRQDSVHRIAWQTSAIGLVIAALLFFVTFFLKDWLFKIMVAVEYHSVSVYLPWIALAAGIFSVGQILSLKLMSEVRVKVLFIAKTCTAILGVAANIVGAWLFGLTGVIAGLLIFSVAYFIWMAFLTWHSPSELNRKMI